MLFLFLSVSPFNPFMGRCKNVKLGEAREKMAFQSRFVRSKIVKAAHKIVANNSDKGQRPIPPAFGTWRSSYPTIHTQEKRERSVLFLEALLRSLSLSRGVEQTREPSRN